MFEQGGGRAVVAASGGVPGKALALIDSDVAAMEKKLLAIAASGDPDNRLREALAREVGGTSNRARLELVIDIVPALLSQLARERPIGEKSGRASWRERVGGDVYISVVAVSLKKQKN